MHSPGADNTTKKPIQKAVFTLFFVKQLLKQLNLQTFAI